MVWARNWAASAISDRLLLANTTSPEVSRSIRWTTWSATLLAALPCRRHASRSRSIAVPISRASNGTVEMPAGLSITTAWVSSQTIRTSTDSSRGRGARILTSTFWPAVSRAPAWSARWPSTNTLPVSMRARAWLHDPPSAPRRKAASAWPASAGPTSIARSRGGAMPEEERQKGPGRLRGGPGPGARRNAASAPSSSRSPLRGRRRLRRLLLVHLLVRLLRARLLRSGLLGGRLLHRRLLLLGRQRLQEPERRTGRVGHHRRAPDARDVVRLGHHLALEGLHLADRGIDVVDRHPGQPVATEAGRLGRHHAGPVLGLVTARHRQHVV